MVNSKFKLLTLFALSSILCFSFKHLPVKLSDLFLSKKEAAQKEDGKKELLKYLSKTKTDKHPVKPKEKQEPELDDDNTTEESLPEFK